ncbi:MAG: DUF4315 family protein [Oscillospiraceae bacterium]|jgi:septal ring factor EnvC (AmiA/AmiB activator)|nr:DUF4315 family protein [Oscillospiraceae bacterium]
MENITNPKIEKVRAELDKAKSRLTHYQSKVRELERQKTELEDEHIVALFRDENLSVEFLALLRERTVPEPVITPAREKIKEEKLYGAFEN